MGVKFFQETSGCFETRVWTKTYPLEYFTSTKPRAKPLDEPNTRIPRAQRKNAIRRHMCKVCSKKHADEIKCRKDTRKILGLAHDIRTVCHCQMSRSAKPLMLLEDIACSWFLRCSLRV